MRLAFLVSDRGRLMQAVIRACQEGLPCTPVVCITDRACEAVAHAPLWHVLDRKSYATTAAFSDDVLTVLQENQIDLALLTFNSLLEGQVLEAYRHRLLNYHPSLLPAFTGFKARYRALASGSTIGGGTLHFVDDGVDTGPVVAQWAVPLLPDDTPSSYGDRQFALGVQATLQALRWIVAGRVIVENGRVRIEGADYGTLPINPSEP